MSERIPGECAHGRPWGIRCPWCAGGQEAAEARARIDAGLNRIPPASFERDDRLGLPGDDLRLEYRVAMLVPCPCPECLAPVGYLCKADAPGWTGFHDSRWREAARTISRRLEKEGP